MDTTDQRQTRLPVELTLGGVKRWVPVGDNKVPLKGEGWNKPENCEAHDPGKKQGYLLSDEDDTGVLDFDPHKIEDPAKRKQAFALMEKLIAKLKDKTFCERSLSGKGSHIWGRFKLNKGKVQNRNIGLEIFAYNQQVIPTGDVLGESTELADIQPEVDELLTLINQPPAVKAAPAKLVAG